MAHLYKNLRVHQVWGANTDVGKTLITTALVLASASRGKNVRYLKPVSTGPIEDSDDRFVSAFSSRYGNLIQQDCLLRLKDSVSPHLALRRQRERDKQKNDSPTDENINMWTTAYIRRCARQNFSGIDLYVETAGGVHSPSLAGASQLDSYRSLRLPALLVGDSRLGGISSTISSYESLVLRGYSIDAVLLFREDYYRNWEYLSDYFSDRGVKVASLASPPAKLADPESNFSLTDRYYQGLLASGEVGGLIGYLDEKHVQRLENLSSMAERTLASIWWPFVQHGIVGRAKDVTVIDSAHGDFFSIFSQQSQESASLLSPQFDGSASWWTQTFGHAQPNLALAAGRAAGRYGHVMFPQASNEPALNLAESLLQRGPGKHWASRVFFSDDGSTAMEVALKMALRAYCKRRGRDLDRSRKQKLGILGLKGSYHGDTIGAMDACYAGDGVYTCEWHQSRGYWLDPPSISMREGKATISLPLSITSFMKDSRSQILADSLPWVYDVEGRLNTHLAETYRSYIWTTLEQLERNRSPRLAALVLEPLILGAGGMVFVDPLFQRILVDVVRVFYDPGTADTDNSWRGLPVIFDEVFVGLYRTGWQSSIPVLGVDPDIAVYAKMLTGGLLPLSVTLAKESVFEAFYSNEKADALLHGHSYTAHAVGCEVANESLAMMEKLASSGTWSVMQDKWKPLTISDIPGSGMWSFWDPDFISDISHVEDVESVMTLGSVLAIKFKDTSGGYASGAAQNRLKYISNRRGGDDSSSIHFRTLGDVAYFMNSLNTSRSVVQDLQTKIITALR